MKKHVNIKAIAGYIFFLCALIIVPLYLENSYFNILQAKAKVTDIIFAVSLIAIIAFVFVRLFSGRKSKYSAAVKHRKPGLADAGLILISISAAIAGLISGRFEDSFLAMDAWGVGIFMIIGFSVCFIFISRNFSYKQNLWLPVLIVNIFIFLFGILNAAHIDTFSLHRLVVPAQYYDYVSTIGNIDWMSGYICLILPCFILFFLDSRAIISDVLYLIVIVLGFLNVILCTGESVYLGLGICLFFAFPYIYRDLERAKRFFLAFAIFGVCLAAVKLIPAFHDNPHLSEGITDILLKPAVFIIWIIVFAALYASVKYFSRSHKYIFLYKESDNQIKPNNQIKSNNQSKTENTKNRTKAEKMHDSNSMGTYAGNNKKATLKTSRVKGNASSEIKTEKEEHGSVLDKPYIISTIISEIVLACAAVILILHLGTGFDDSFGTDRGLIWRTALENYGSLPLHVKIFGVGPGLLGDYLSGLSDVLPRQVLAAHSQPLEIFMTTGIAGVLGWCALWTGVFAEYFRKKLWGSSRAIFFVPLAAYFGQSLVNTSMALHVAVLCVVLICFRSLEDIDTSEAP